MEKIIEYIDNFLETEYLANQLKWDLSIPDEEAIPQGKKVAAFFHNIYPKSSYGRTEGLFDDEDFRDFAPIKQSRVQKRTLFQIKKYQNPECGEVLQRYIKNDIVYLCFTGYDEKLKNRADAYSSIFVVAETDEGLKIINSLFFHKGEVTFTLSPESDTELRKLYHVLNPGTLVEVKKFQAPDEETSLNEYNAE